MRGTSLIGLTLALSLATGGCSRDAGAPPGAPVPDGHNGRTALDWAGTYSGILPCASCPGIETVVTLNADGSYRRSRLYLDEGPAPIEDSGAFAWDASGNTVTLGDAGDDAQQFGVGENALFHLDRQGERIVGDLAAHYVLRKHVRDAAIEDRSWKLVELRGQPLAAGEGIRTPNLLLRSADAAASGNASCNSFTGRYAITSGERIRFGPNMVLTMMACPEMGIEREFLEVLRMTDNYSVPGDGTLSLNRARMAPLARFEAVRGEE